MKTLYRAVFLLACAPWAAAQTSPSTGDGAPPPAEAPKRPDIEGAAGLLLAYRPAFSGSSQRRLRPELAGFLRWGRITLSGAGGFTTRAREDVERGLDAELLQRDTLRVDLAVRFDPGRAESDSDQLAGLGDIRPTLRARLGLRWSPAPGWGVNLATSVDALNRVGGYVVSAGVSRSVELDARQRLIFGAGVSGAGDRYMQAWYGITPAQSAASGYPAYTAAEGLRDVSASATWRIEFNPRWAGFAGVSVSRLVGAAADSPLTLQRNGVGLSAGLARRF